MCLLVQRCDGLACIARGSPYTKMPPWTLLAYRKMNTVAASIRAMLTYPVPTVLLHITAVRAE